MTLLFRRRQLEAAVAGELSAHDDAEVLVHVRGCVSCRAHYDALVLAQRALEGVPVSRVELERERRRLEASLSGAPARRRNVMPVLVPALALAAALIFFVARPDDVPEVTERGGDEAAAPFVVSVYAKSKEGSAKARLAAELPASGEARVSARDWVQVSVPKDVVVVLVRDGEPAVFVELGTSSSFTAGEYRLFAVSGASADEVKSAASAATRSTKRLALGKPQVTGVVFVEP